MPNLFPAARGYVLGMQTWTSGRLWSGAEMSPQHPSFWNKVGAGWSEFKVDAQTVQGTANLLVATMPSHVLCRLCLPLHLALDYSCLWVSLCVFVLSLSLFLFLSSLLLLACSIMFAFSVFQSLWIPWYSTPWQPHGPVTGVATHCFLRSSCNS